FAEEAERHIRRRARPQMRKHLLRLEFGSVVGGELQRPLQRFGASRHTAEGAVENVEHHEEASWTGATTARNSGDPSTWPRPETSMSYTPLPIRSGAKRGGSAARASGTSRGTPSSTGTRVIALRS